MTMTDRFNDLFSDIATTRHHYEELRMAEGSFEERSRMLSRLHMLRAEMASERSMLVR